VRSVIERQERWWLWHPWLRGRECGLSHTSVQRWLDGAGQRAMAGDGLWTIYRNFEPRQERSEHHRHYRWLGTSPLEAAGVDTEGLCYLDALGI